MNIIIATNNQGKVKEIKKIYKTLGINFLSLRDFPKIKKIKEQFKTYEENALQKARTISELTNMITLADDSGIEIDAIDGKPGVFSARFGGRKISDKERNQKILRLLKNTTEGLRKAKFVCVIAIVKPGGRQYIVKSSCNGRITEELRGKSGFGYDPIFFVSKYNKTFAEMDADLKNKISHRGKALRKAEKILQKLTLQEKNGC